MAILRSYQLSDYPYKIFINLGEGSLFERKTNKSNIIQGTETGTTQILIPCGQKFYAPNLQEVYSVLSTHLFSDAKFINPNN